MRLLSVAALLALTACSTPQPPPGAPTGQPPSPQPAATIPRLAPGQQPSPIALASPIAGADRTQSQGNVRPDPSLDVSSSANWKDFERGGGSNIVQLVNFQDGRFRARGNAELDRIRGDDVRPVNMAEAHATCTDCQTIVAALQVAIYQRGANAIAPVNKATAVNENCTRCVTVARAIQYVIPVDDVRSVPRDVDDLVKRINKEADYFERIKDLDRVDPNEADRRLNQLKADFTSLQQFLNDIVDRKDDGGPSPSPAVSPMPSPSATAH